MQRERPDQIAGISQSLRLLEGLRAQALMQTGALLRDAGMIAQVAGNAIASSTCATQIACASELLDLFCRTLGERSEEPFALGEQSEEPLALLLNARVLPQAGGQTVVHRKRSVDVARDSQSEGLPVDLFQ